MLFFFPLENKKNYFWVFTFFVKLLISLNLYFKNKAAQKMLSWHFYLSIPPPLLSITIEERHKNVTSVSSMFSVTIFHILFTIQSQRISSNYILFRHAPKWTFFLLHQMYPTQMLLRLSSMDYQISLSLSSSFDYVCKLFLPLSFPTSLYLLSQTMSSLSNVLEPFLH